MVVEATKGNSNFYENKQFTTNPGIYFENISPLHIAISQWNFLTFYNISNYENSYAFINIYFDRYKLICQRFENKSTDINDMCTNFKKINSALLDKINDERETLQQYLNIDKKHNLNPNGDRTKRSSFFGGIGKLQRALFGVLTEEEGEEYQNKIRLLEEKQLKTLLLQKDQIKIFESTLDLVTKISLDFTKIKGNLNDYINKINHEIINQKEELKIINIKEYIMLYNSVYSELINQFSKETSIILNTVPNNSPQRTDQFSNIKTKRIIRTI